MKDLILGLLIGGIVGLWFGVNLGKGQPIYTNPFIDKTTLEELKIQVDQMQKQVSEKSKHLYEDTKKSFNEAIKD